MHSHKIPKYIFLFIIFLAAFVRFWRLDLPSHYYFDEQYHVPAAKLILHGDTRAFEWWPPALESDPDAINDSHYDWLHPPLAKYFQAVSMKVFGENSLGWRLPSAIFGMSVIGMVYVLAKEMFDNKVALTAMGLVSLSGVLLVQSRIAMNDIFVTFFILVVVYLFERYRKTQANKWLLWLGVSLGLAVATKWSGFFIVVSSWFIVFRYVHSSQFRVHGKVRKIPLLIFALILLPITIYTLSYLPMFLQGKDFSYFIELQKHILQFQFHENSFHPYHSRPWEWFFNWRPVWYWKGNTEVGKMANIYLIENPVLALLGVVAVMWNLKEIFKKTNTLNHELRTLNTAFYAAWLPWIFSPRPLFYYHYTPAIPFLCILIAIWLQKRRFQWLIWGLLLIGFGLYLPHWLGLSVPQTFAHQVYFILPNWK